MVVQQRERHGFESLAIDEPSIAHLSTLASHHRDPFDRLLICQALEYRLQIVTIDPMITRYSADVLHLT
jgi:PIN domain nuclease of toxin-antitoxin system